MESHYTPQTDKQKANDKKGLLELLINAVSWTQNITGYGQ